MLVADRSVSAVEIDATMWAGVRQAPAVRHLDVVLKPLSRPELGEIRVDAAVFAIGRTEHPFVSYGNDILNMLSRRHASIFRNDGLVYLVDLQSRNGTTVNRVGIGHAPCQLRDGDEICFGGALSYRVQITARVRPEGSLTLTLTPESGDSGLETIGISKFPFLVSKTDGIFSHYKSEGDHGGELRYLSRRHAHIYQKGDQAYIGDLGSANGTFIDGQRLQDQAIPLQDGATVSFGGKHFVYRVRIVRESGVEPAPIDVRQAPVERQPPAERSSLEKGGVREEIELTAKREALEQRELTAKREALEKREALVRREAVLRRESPAASAPLGQGKPLTQGNSQAAGKPRPEVRSQLEVRSQAEARPPQSIGKPQSEVRPQPEAKLPEAAGKPRPEGKSPEAAGKFQTQPKSPQTIGKPQSEVGPQSEVRPQAELKPSEAAGKLQPQAKAPQTIGKPQSEVRPLSQVRPQLEVRPQAKAKPPEVAGKPQTQAKSPEAAGKPQTQAKSPKAAGKPQTQAKSPEAAGKPQTQAKSPEAAGKPQSAGDLNLLAMDSGTQFMAAPTSFLTVLCAADEPKKEVAPAAATDPAAASAKEPPVKRRPRGRVMLLLSELVTLIKGEPDGTPRRWWRFAAVGGVLVALVLTAYFWNASERALKDAIARGDYARAAALATRLLEKHPDDLEFKAWTTEMSLKATVPAWLAKVRARDFDGAKGVLTDVSGLSKRDDDLRPMLDELEWLGNLERLVSDRGGPAAPIRIYADEDSIEHLIGRWNEDTGEHQRTLARIASRVPQFADWYGEALTHLRRLQSESTVYLSVVERVKANIATELARDNPDVLKPALKEIAEKYPRLGGMDSVRQDLARYIEIRREARSRKSGRLFALLHKARFVTPPFEQSYRALVASGQLPPADLIRQYDAATRAWKEYNPSEALAGLQKMAAGPWAEEISRELERRQVVAAGFAALQQSRDATDHVDQLLAFRESLDADEDVYFVRATAADLSQQKDKVIARAQDAMNQARTSWQEYRSNGAIDASQRIETSISDEFRIRAHLLAEASKYAWQSFLLYSQVDAAGVAQWTEIRDEIESEAREQRSRLRDLSNVVEPALLKAKLALLGDSNE